MPRVPKKAQRQSSLEGTGELSDVPTTEATTKRELRRSVKTNYCDDYPQFTDQPKRSSRASFGSRQKKTKASSVLETSYTEDFSLETSAPARDDAEVFIEPPAPTASTEGESLVETQSVSPPTESLQQQDTGRLSTEADKVAKPEEAQPEPRQSTKVDSSGSEPGQGESEAVPTKPKRIIQTRSVKSTNHEKEPSPPAAFEATAKETHDKQTAGAKPKQASRSKAVSSRSKKQPEMTLEASHMEASSPTPPADNAGVLSHPTIQANGNASTQTLEGRLKRGRNTRTADDEVTFLAPEDSEPVRKRTKMANRSTMDVMEVSAIVDLTVKEDARTSARTKTKASKAPLKSPPRKGKKPAVTLSSKSKKKRSQQIERTPARSSITEVPVLTPAFNEAKSRKPAREAEDSERVVSSDRQRNNVNQKSAPIVRRRLAPLEPAPPRPQIPEGLEGKWSYSEEARIYLADFREVTTTQLPDRDMKFLLDLMARDDLTVVSEGLWTPAFEKLVELEYLKAAFGNQIHHKFRMFFRKAEGGYEEKPDGLSMRASDFFGYLEMKMAKKSDGERLFCFVDTDGKHHKIDVDNVSIYMIDCDLPKILPLLYDKYISNFKARAILPGGEMCMMSAMNHTGRPFMGPNLYVAPGGGFTSLHQDGEGTVDSGHSCIRGYNEVVMLRRLPEAHKHYATEQLGYDGVHNLPHDIGTTYENVWPKKSVIEKWKKMNYYPSVFVLGPGQHLHINKSRLHTFRKAKAEQLDEDDCHFDLRNALLGRGLSKQDELCISVAFDWMFLGNSRESIDEEVGTSLHCADICREVGSSSLGIPETCLLGLAELLSRDAGTAYNELLHPIRHAACQGILSHLKVVVEREIELGSGISKKAKMPDSQQNPDSYGIDPFGSDYFCFTCKRELANSYFHCLGCETLLQKDLNICKMCLEEKRYGTNMPMGVKCKSRNSDIIHAGGLEKKGNTRGCSCHQGICRECGYCKSCSCRCHHDFQLHYRFYTPDELTDILKRVEDIAAGANDEQVEACASLLQENHSMLSCTTDHSAQKPLTQPAGQIESRDAEQTVNHEVLPTCASELVEDHSMFPGAADRETNGGAGQILNYTVLSSESKRTPRPNVKTNALATPEDPSLVKAGVSKYKACYTDVTRLT